MASKRILVAAKERAWRVKVATFLHAEGFVVTEVADFDVARQLAQKDQYDLVLFDYDVLEGDPFNLLYQWHKDEPRIAILLMAPATFPYLPGAFQKSGVIECLHKPLSLSSIRSALQKVLALPDFERASEEPKELASSLSAGGNDEKREETIIGSSTAMKGVLEIVDKVADSDSTILITGESGTGKELIARRLHRFSGRKNFPLVSVSCSALPESLLESELFGHERGAFTGAVEARIGRFMKAHRGTIFLDEIGDLSHVVQVKLLRVIQEKEFEAVGSNTPRKVDVRIIAATHQSLENAVAEKRFREDLYYRLNVIPIRLPPLRARGNDVSFLIDYFIRFYNKKERRSITGISPEALALLLQYNWPGNVRELENLIERVVILKGEGEIGCEDFSLGRAARRLSAGQESLALQDLPSLPRSGSPGGCLAAEGGKEISSFSAICAEGKMTFSCPLAPEGINLKEILFKIERELLLQALARTRWNKNRAAKLLCLKRTTLIEKIKRFDLEEVAASPEGGQLQTRLPIDVYFDPSTEGHA